MILVVFVFLKNLEREHILPHATYISVTTINITIKAILITNTDNITLDASKLNCLKKLSLYCIVLYGDDITSYVKFLEYIKRKYSLCFLS